MCGAGVRAHAGEGMFRLHGGGVGITALTFNFLRGGLVLLQRRDTEGISSHLVLCFQKRICLFFS